MTRMKKNYLNSKNKKYYIGFIAFFVIALVIGVKSVYAYYYEDDAPSGNLFASAVGNIYEYIDKNNADIAIRIYKKVNSGTGIYIGQTDIPSGTGPTKVECTNGTSGTSVTCNSGTVGNGQTATGCHYSYSSSGTPTIKIQSSSKAICSFYFD